MLKSKELLVVGSFVSLLAFPFAASAATLSASCVGTPSATNITWSASTTGGIPPVAVLWSNGSTSTTQIIPVAPGTYSMSLQAIDASSTVATTTCSATVATPTPPGPSLNDQITAVLNQIAALKTQLAQLLAQQANSNPGTATSTPSGCFNFGHDLAEGSQGNDVKNLQETLASDSSIFPATLVTGYFGPLTQEAVKKFQAKHGITPTGYFGPMSRTFFDNQCSSGDSNHNGIPDSIDHSNGQDTSSDRPHATSTVSSEHVSGGSGSSQGAVQTTISSNDHVSGSESQSAVEHNNNSQQGNSDNNSSTQQGAGDQPGNGSHGN